MAEMEKKTVNAMGDVCPVPLVKAKNAIAELAGSGKVEVLVDNEIAVQNLEKMAQQKGYGFLVKEKKEKGIMWSSPYQKQSRLKQKRKPYASYRRQRKQNSSFFLQTIWAKEPRSWVKF